MSIFRNHVFAVFVALMSLFVFSGGLLADAVADSKGHCPATQKSGADQDSCEYCVCNLDGSLETISQTPVLFYPAPTKLAFASLDEVAPDGEPRPIDHPPQLA